MLTGSLLRLVMCTSQSHTHAHTRIHTLAHRAHLGRLISALFTSSFSSLIDPSFHSTPRSQCAKSDTHTRTHPHTYTLSLPPSFSLFSFVLSRKNVERSHWSSDQVEDHQTLQVTPLLLSFSNDESTKDLCVLYVCVCVCVCVCV